MPFASLNTMQPENVAHGSEILIQIVGPGAAGGPITIGEVYDMTFDADNKVALMPILGDRRTGARRGRYEVKGTIKAYWLSSTLRSVYLGLATPSSAGYGSSLYHSRMPFSRYQIQVNPSNFPGSVVSMPPLTFYGVVFEKDTVSWNSDKFSTEDIAFVAEDIYGG